MNVPLPPSRVSRLARVWRSGVVTALLTVALAALFALAVDRGRIVVRVPRGDVWEYRAMPIAAVWHTLLDRLPPEAPGLFNRDLLTVLLMLAGLASAYVIVATLRLPRS
ncbi:MAG: hypothetical protein M3Q65_02450 [Chloroflexota bacterium]|nr:hypothetical protein [Chloroflexota bacterium]